MVISSFDVGMRPPEVEEALSHQNRFDTMENAAGATQEAINLLSEYIQLQLENGVCDLEANLALLEYVFFLRNFT